MCDRDCMPYCRATRNNSYYGYVHNICLYQCKLQELSMHSKVGMEVEKVKKEEEINVDVLTST